MWRIVGSMIYELLWVTWRDFLDLTIETPIQALIGFNLTGTQACLFHWCNLFITWGVSERSSRSRILFHTHTIKHFNTRELLGDHLHIWVAACSNFWSRAWQHSRVIESEVNNIRNLPFIACGLDVKPATLWLTNQSGHPSFNTLCFRINSVVSYKKSKS